MVTQEEHYQFLKKYYRSRRFEERNTAVWGTNYSRNIAAHGYKHLQEFGYGLISRHSSVTGEGIIYDVELNLLDSIPKRSPVDSAQESLPHE